MAYHALKAFGLDHESIMAGMESFKGLKHRQQYVGTLGKVTFINDSKATSANAAEQALKTFDTIYWLVGGQDKSDGIESLVSYFSKIKKAYVFGAAKDRFAKTFADHSLDHAVFDTMDEALLAAYKDAFVNTVPSTLLLSPACASFDQYKDFEARGDYFINRVETLLGAR
jgi:UDP-N-acetylmuramoylalanine--D-glutamate ligase